MLKILGSLSFIIFRESLKNTRKKLFEKQKTTVSPRIQPRSNLKDIYLNTYLYWIRFTNLITIQGLFSGEDCSQIVFRIFELYNFVNKLNRIVSWKSWQSLEQFKNSFITTTVTVFSIYRVHACYNWKLPSKIYVQRFQGPLEIFPFLWHLRNYFPTFFPVES